AGVGGVEAHPATTSARAPRSKLLVRGKQHLHGLERGGAVDVRAPPVGTIVGRVSQVDRVTALLHPQRLPGLPHLHAVDEDVPGVAEAYDDEFHRRSSFGRAGQAGRVPTSARTGFCLILPLGGAAALEARGRDYRRYTNRNARGNRRRQLASLWVPLASASRIKRSES